MTTFQDSPLQSRRAVRQQAERDSAPAAVVPTTGPAPTPVAAPAPAEPLTYATQGRAHLPNYDGPAPRSRRTPAPVGETPDWAPPYEGAGSTPVAPDASSTFAPHPPAQPVVLPSALDNAGVVEHTLTRRELRALRDAHGIQAAPEEVAPAHPGTPLAAPSSRLDSAVAEFDQLTGRTTGPVPSVESAPRGRRAAAKPAEEGPAAPVVEPSPVVEAPPVVEPSPVVEAPPVVEAAPAAESAPQVQPLPAESARASVAPVEASPSSGPAQIAPEALGPIPVLNEPPAQAPVTESSVPDGVAVFDALFPDPVAAAPESPVAVPVRSVPEDVAPARPPVAPEPEPVESDPGAPAPPAQVETEVVVAEIVIEPEPEAAAPSVPATASEPSTATPPTGHWSTQAQLDDQTQFGDAPLARNIGATSGTVTTSALVLPSIPDSSFGQIGAGDMVTGSISLPPSLSTTGALRAQLDESELDHLLDPGDSQVASTDSQPVRAIKAVSTHTTSGGVINTGKPKGTRGLTALIVAATSMAVVVGALFIVLVATGQL